METPRQRDPETKKQRPARPSFSGGGSRRRRHRPRAVLVEDEFVVLLSLEDLLKSLGCEVVATTQDAGEALGLVRSLRPDFVFMDLRLGESDAVAATRAITTETEARVIVVTAYAEAQTQAVKEAGASRVLTKPVQERQLAEAIAGLTNRPTAPSRQGSAAPLPSCPLPSWDAGRASHSDGGARRRRTQQAGR